MAGQLTVSVRPGPGAVADPNAKRNVLQHLCARTHLKQLAMEFNTACPPSEDCNNGVEVNFVESAKESLKEVQKVKTAFESKALALQRIQLVGALRNRMKQNDGRARLIMGTMRDVIKLNLEIIQAHQQTLVIRENLNDIRRKRYLLKQAGGEKALQIFTTRRKRREVMKTKITEKLKSIHRSVQHERKVTTLIQNILQNIVIGCRINWAKDPSLRAIILQLEKDFSIQNAL